MRKNPRVAAVLLGIVVYLAFLFLPIELILGAGLISPAFGDAVYDFLSLFSSLPTALLLLALWRIAGKGPKDSVGFAPGRASWKSHIAAFALGFCGNRTVSCILSLLPETWTASYARQTEDLLTPQNPWLSIIAVVLSAPICEEVIFRGMIFRSFRQAMPFYWAAVLSALLFGAAHGHPLWIGYAFVLGFFLAILAGRTETISISIAAHIGFNSPSLLDVLLPEDFQLLNRGWFLLTVGLLAALGAVVIWRKYFLRAKWEKPDEGPAG